jgi:hypothetical protein
MMTTDKKKSLSEEEVYTPALVTKVARFGPFFPYLGQIGTPNRGLSFQTPPNRETTKLGHISPNRDNIGTFDPILPISPNYVC